MYKKIIIILLIFLVSVSSANAKIWESNASITSGLTDVGSESTPGTFNDSGTLKLISGENTGVFNGWYWNGTGWTENTSIVAGLPDIGSRSNPTIFDDSGTWKLISGEWDGEFFGYYWNGTGWTENTSIVAGLTDVGSYSTPTVYDDSGTFKLISGEFDGHYNGWAWNGTSWVSDSNVINGLIRPYVDSKTDPFVYDDSGTLKLIVGVRDGSFRGYYWSGTTWVSDSDIIIGLPADIGTWASPAIYDDSGTWKLISGEVDGDFFGYEFVYGSTELYSPTNASTLNYTYPPLLHSVTLDWNTTIDPEIDSYRYQVSETEEFTIIVADGYTTDTSIAVSLAADTYYWRVYTYNTVTETLSGVSDVWTFTVAQTGGIGTGTAIAGVVYTDPNGNAIELNNAVVSIYNTTWSDQMTTGPNGYYLFEDLKAAETYTIQATKTDYSDSQFQYVTTVLNETITRNILMELREDESQYYSPHKVKFVVKNIWDTRYSDVTVNVYKGNEITALYAGSTETDGSITFKLNEEQEYRLTFINSTQGINEELILYPKNEVYNVYVVTTSIQPDDQYSSEELETTISKQIINNSHAYINVTYLDNLNGTTGLNIFLNQSIANDPFNQTVIDSYSGTTNNTTVSFIVEDYAGQTYFTNIDITHTIFDSVQRSFAVSFDGMQDAHGFTVVYIWGAIGGIMFVGMLWKPTTAKYGMLIVCGCAWIFIILGWVDNLGAKGVLAITAGTTLATILSIAAIMAKGEKEG